MGPIFHRARSRGTFSDFTHLAIIEDVAAGKAPPRVQDQRGAPTQTKMRSHLRLSPKRFPFRKARIRFARCRTTPGLSTPSGKYLTACEYVLWKSAKLLGGTQFRWLVFLS